MSQSVEGLSLQPLNFSGRRAVITGAGGGIGAAASRALAKYGASVVLLGRTEARLEEVAAGIRRSGGDATSAVCDVGDWDSLQRTKEALFSTGRVDLWVNNAGSVAPQALTWEVDVVEWAASVQTNLLGVLHGLRAVLPHMIARGAGTVVNLSSGAANGAVPGWSQYCATKAGAQRLTAVAHRELREAGHDDVHVVGLSPGTVATPMMESIRRADINAVSRLDPTAHIPAAWAGEAVAFLCGPAGREFAGTDFSIKTNDGRARVGLPGLLAG